MKPARDPLDVAIGAELRRRREAARLTLTEVGKALGLTYQQIQKYETGTNRVAMATAVRMADVLRCSPGDLFATVAAQPEGAPLFPSGPALRIAELMRPLAPELQSTVERIVSDVLGVFNRAELVEVARDGHPALSYAH